MNLFCLFDVALVASALLHLSTGLKTPPSDENHVTDLAEYYDTYCLCDSLFFTQTIS